MTEIRHWHRDIFTVQQEARMRIKMGGNSYRLKDLGEILSVTG